MKKQLLIISTIVTIMLSLVACNNKEVEQLRRERDSLLNASNEKQGTIDQYIAAFNEIQQNLNMIKQKEHIITMQTTDTSEMSPAQKDQINNDILTIYQLMQDNKNSLETLKKQIKSSGVKNKQLNDLIAQYEQQLKEKDTEIDQLKTKLEQMNFDMTTLNQRLDTMKQVQNQQSQVINQQDAQLHTTYYIVGTKTELKDKKILTRDGFLAKLSLDANFDKSNFIKIDYRNLDEIPVNASDAQILTTHPTNSYKVVKNSKGIVEKIAITDKDAFWSLSKFLVLMVK